MNDYKKYVIEINNIFAILEKLKKAWTSSDNFDLIEEINEYKDSVIAVASFLQEQSSTNSSEKGGISE